jgi:hypothetical protein
LKIFCGIENQDQCFDRHLLKVFAPGGGIFRDPLFKVGGNGNRCADSLHLRF